MSQNIRLTQFSKGGGCGCKIAPSVLQQIVQTTDNKSFQNLLVGNDSSDDAAVYLIKVKDEKGISLAALRKGEETFSFIDHSRLTIFF